MRGSRSGFDVAFNAVRASDSVVAAEQVQQYAEAGGTWWMELAPDEDEGGLPAYRDRIRQGPPERR